MDIRQAIQTSLAQSDAIVQAYLQDLSPADLMARPCSGVNHIAWQLGHLVASEAYFLNKIQPGSAPELPAGFAEAHNKATAASNEPGKFSSREQYQQLAKTVRAATLKLVSKLADGDFDKPVPAGLPPFLKTVGETLLFFGTHWVMHAGQWAVTRRSVGKPPLF